MQCLNQSIVKRTPDIWTSEGWVELGPGRFCWEKNVAAKIFVSDRFTYPSGSQLWALKQCKILDLKNICPWLPFFVSLYFSFHSCAHLSIFLSKKKFWRNYANFWCSDDLWRFFCACLSLNLGPCHFRLVRTSLLLTLCLCNRAVRWKG